MYPRAHVENLHDGTRSNIARAAFRRAQCSRAFPLRTFVPVTFPAEIWSEGSSPAYASSLLTEPNRVRSPTSPSQVITVWVPTPGMLSRFNLSWRQGAVRPSPIRQVKSSTCLIHDP